MASDERHERRGMARFGTDFAEGYGGDIGGGYAGQGGYAGAGYARPEDATMRHVRRAHGEPPRPFQGARPRGLRRRDERIRDDVCALLAHDSWIDASDVDVRVEDGEVVLEGRVDTRDARRRAEDLAWSVVGVEDVIVRLRAKRDPGTESIAGQEVGTTDVVMAGASRAGT